MERLHGVTKVQSVPKPARERGITLLHFMHFLKAASIFPSTFVHFTLYIFFWGGGMPTQFISTRRSSDLFSIARFHDNIIKILLLPSLCITAETQRSIHSTFKLNTFLYTELHNSNPEFAAVVQNSEMLIRGLLLCVFEILL